MAEIMDPKAENQTLEAQRDTDPVNSEIAVPDDGSSVCSTKPSYHDDSDEDDIAAPVDPLPANTTRIRYNDHTFDNEHFIDAFCFFEDQLEFPLKKYYECQKGNEIPPIKLKKFRRQCRQQQALARRRVQAWKDGGRVGYEPLPTRADAPAKYGIFYDSDTDSELDCELIKIFKRKKKGASILKRKRSVDREGIESAKEVTNECHPSPRMTKKKKTVKWSEWVQAHSPCRKPRSVKSASKKDDSKPEDEEGQEEEHEDEHEDEHKDEHEEELKEKPEEESEDEPEEKHEEKPEEE